MSSGRDARSFLLEAVVIVASILLAFAVDAWWEGEVEAREERALLVRLEADLEVFEGILIPDSRESSEEVLESIGLLADYAQGVRVPPDDSMTAALATVTGGYQFAAASPVFDLLTSDGGYVRIENAELAEALAQMASFLELVRRFEELDDAFVTGELKPWLHENVDRWAAIRDRSASWEDMPASRYDPGWEAMRSRTFANLLAERYSRLYRVMVFRRSFANATARTHAALDAALEE